MDITVTGAWDQGDDVLRVEGTLDGEAATAYGWVTATTNYYPPDAYADDGHLVDGAKARAMKKGELRDYCTRLLADAAPPAETPPERQLL